MSEGKSRAKVCVWGGGGHQKMQSEFVGPSDQPHVSLCQAC